MQINALTGAFGAEVFDIDLKGGINPEQAGLIEDALAKKGISNEHFFVMQHGETRSLQFLLR